MSRQIAVALIMFALVACGAQPATVPTPVPAASQPTITPPAPTATPAVTLDHAAWAGGIVTPDGSSQSIILNLDESGGTLIVQPRSEPLTIEIQQRTATALEFTATDDAPMRFLGLLDRGQLAGQVERNGASRPFTLTPLAAPAPAELSPLLGLYRFDSGAALSINLAPSFSDGELDFFWPGLTLNDFAGGAVRGLYPLGADTFLVGSARVLGHPFAAQIGFERDAQGQASGLIWQQRDPLTGAGDPRVGGAASSASRVALITETVSYPAGDGVTLTGLLTRPAAGGPHPAMVVLHGSERGTRDDFGRQQLSAFLASQGFAALTYDKRGVGDSGGRYSESAAEANLSLLAEDALAGVAYLKQLPDIAAAHIGLIGPSQAGWSIPLAARSSDVAFFVVISGPLVSVGVENSYSGYTNDGESASQRSAEEISRLLADVAPSGFDPIPVVQGLTQPGLWLWGGQDKSVPVPESASALDRLIAAGRTNFSYHIFAAADHNLQQTSQGLFAEIPTSPGYPGDYYATLGAWLKERVK
jgi:dienelactone hydrolase